MATQAQIDPGLEQQVEEALAGGAETTETDPKDVLKGLVELQDAVKGLAKHFMGLDKWPRRQEVIDARRQRYYWRDIQYIYWKSDTVGFTLAASGSTVSLGANETEEIPRYTDVYNIYTPYGESLISTLIQNPPGVNWQPEDMSKAEDITASQTAQKYQQKIEKDNNRKSLQAEVARLFYTDGRTVLHTRREKDVDLITAHGVLETKVIPITANCREELVFASISKEIDVYKAKSDHSEYKAKIKEGSSSLGESSYERIARLGVLQGRGFQAGDAFAHMVTRHVIFLRTCTFEKLEEKFRAQVQALFPDGMVVTFCGDAYCGSENASMDNRISIRFPGPGDGMSRPSMGNRLVPLQDVFNDEVNLWHEAHDHCVPTLFMYSETGDLEAIREQSSSPGNIIGFTSLPPGATNAGSAFYEAALKAIPDTLPKFVQFVQGPLAQFITGAFPALFGGDTGDNDTAKGISIQRDQAMGRMGLPWGHLQELFAEAYMQAVMSAVENDDDDAEFVHSGVDAAGNSIAEKLSVDDMRNGKFKCFPDTDTTFPETTNSKRQAIQNLMAAAERNPILAETMAQPSNQELAHEMVGLPELIVPGAIARNKQLIEISALLKEAPIPPPMPIIKEMATKDPQLLKAMAEWEQQKEAAEASGQPTPPMPIPMEMCAPSIKVDLVFDFHQYEFQTIKDFLSSEDARKEITRGNTKGIENVKLHGIQHQQAMAASAAPAPGAPPIGPKAAEPILNQPNQQPPPAGQ